MPPRKTQDISKPLECIRAHSPSFFAGFSIWPYMLSFTIGCCECKCILAHVPVSPMISLLCSHLKSPHAPASSFTFWIYLESLPENKPPPPHTNTHRPDTRAEHTAAICVIAELHCILFPKCWKSKAALRLDSPISTSADFHFLKMSTAFIVAPETIKHGDSRQAFYFSYIRLSKWEIWRLWRPESEWPCRQHSCRMEGVKRKYMSALNGCIVHASHIYTHTAMLWPASSQGNW